MCGPLCKKEQILSVRRGGLFEGQLVVCCNHKRDRKTISYSLSLPSTDHYTMARFLKLGWPLGSKIFIKLLLMVSVWQNSCRSSVFLSKYFKWKISGVAVLWVVECIPVCLFGILPISYLLAVECYDYVVFHHLAQCLAHKTLDEGLLNYDFLKVSQISQ